MNTVMVFAEKLSKRSEYIIETLLDSFIGIKVVFASELSQFHESPLPRFSYLEKGIENIPNIHFSGKINSTDLRLMTFPQEDDFQLNTLHIQYDIFAFCFFMLSRIEEYGSDSKDTHGRFVAESSLLAQHNSLHIPVVDVFTEALKKWLTDRFPMLTIPIPQATAILTFDIDIAYSLKAKPLIRQAGRIAEELVTLKFRRLNERLAVLSGHRADPFDIYDDLAKLSSETNIPMIFFFQVVSRGKYDRAALNSSNSFKNLVRKVSEFATIGIHPSYSGGQDTESIIREKSILEEITGKEVVHSRQHFLRLIFPHTPGELVKAGIKYDYSMGFASALGWRAGTCRPFRLFHAAKDELLPLITYPISFMDGTLREYLNLYQEEARQKISDIIACVKQYNGTFIPLWHNESISETGKWKGWRNDVFEPMVSDLQKNLISI